ncbi:MAG TPA: PfkB family carbohydrate kinase, partial [Pseudonocardiaceae bacterium]|nr:PfkB family carbohydrate kinase [Pseudonocardiaceae bacterium]
TLGAAGARWGEAKASAPKIDVVDTTGAGDAFAGALAAALAAGADRAEALQAAAHAGATACTWPGAQGWSL